MSTLSEPATTSAERRASGFLPIADYGLLADCTSAALVDRDGSIDWLCLPRYDCPPSSPASSTPTPATGRSRPRAESPPSAATCPGTLVIETTFTTPTGSVRLIDAMAFAEGQRGHDLGLDAPHELLRLVEGIAGTVELVVELAPRPEYGLVRPLFRLEDGGGRTFGGPNQIAVSAGVPVEVEDATMRARFTVRDGERVGFALRWAAAESARPMARAARRASPLASTTPSRAGAPGRPSTTSTTARTASWSASARAC